MATGSARLRLFGFTLTELLIVIGIVALIITILLPIIERTRRENYRPRCSSNLRQIGQALLLYSNDYHGDYPRTKYDPASPTITFYTGVNAANPFGPEGPSANDVTAAYFLLIRTEDIDPRAFVCDSVENAEAWDFSGGTWQTRSNWPSRQNLSYSFANPYPSPAAAAAGYKLSSSMNPDLAVASDMNPGNPVLLTIGTSTALAQMRTANTLNHGGDGQNVLYADGHVEFQDNPFVGVNRDNIFTFGASGPTVGGEGIDGFPVGPNDSVLLPTQLDGPANTPAPFTLHRLIKTHADLFAIIISFVVTIVVITSGISLWERLAKPRKLTGG